MRLLKAQVVDNTDFTNTGTMLVFCKDLGQDYIPVNYVSPYSAKHHGGFIAIPEIGVEVLISQPDGTNNEWYYMGSIFSHSEGTDGQGSEVLDAQDPAVPDKQIYRARGKPQRIVISDATGNKLVLSNSYNPKYFNLKAALESALGKRLELNDSPKRDCIILKNEHEDGIKITSTPQKSSAARSIEVESLGPIKTISRESEVEVLVIEGREIDITNESTGLNKDDDLPNRFGNINVRSKKMDINLTTDEAEGSIFLTCLGGEGIIQLASNGKITVWAETDVEIRAGGDLKLKADENITIEAGASIDIKAGAALDIESGGATGVKAGGNVNLDGAEVHLNSGNAQGAQETEITRNSNHYEE